MRLQDCDLDVTAIVTRPLVKNEPEEEWVEANKLGVIPPALYHYYSGAKFFSFRGSPRFLADTEKILFPYVGTLARGILESLCQAEELTKEILDAHEKTYTPLKKAKGKSWDRRAGEQALRCFKHLLVELNGALDQLAEIVAIYFHGEGTKLSPGRASFEDLKRFVLAPLNRTKTIITPRFPLVEKLHTSLALEIVGKGQEKEWYELMLLYRNKLAHLGNAMFVRMSFPKKEETCSVFYRDVGMGTFSVSQRAAVVRIEESYLRRRRVRTSARELVACLRRDRMSFQNFGSV
jgi:hypothetical protein